MSRQHRSSELDVERWALGIGRLLSFVRQSPSNSYPAQWASVTNNTSHMSATAALAWTNVCNESVKIIAVHQPTRFPPIREPQAKIDNAISAAATVDGKRAAKSFSPKILKLAACVQ